MIGRKRRRRNSWRSASGNDLVCKNRQRGYKGRMSEPIIAQKSPFVLKVKAASYYWCACGKSKNQPFCDGSHKSSSFAPKMVDITEEKTVAWCDCKHSKNGAFCDGSHAKLG